MLNLKAGTRLVGFQDYRPLVKLRQPPVSDSRAFLVEGKDSGVVR